MEVDEERVTKMYKRLKNAKEHVWSHWNKEYINSLMEVHRIKVDVWQIFIFMEVLILMVVKPSNLRILK